MSVTPTDPPSRLLDTPLGPVAVREEGPAAGPVLLLVHGVPGSGRDFRHLAPRLAGATRVVRLELPGFGDTPLHDGYDLSLPARSRVVVAALDALGVDRAVVGGHSMGGGTAIVTAARHPDRVRGLALLASVGPYRHRGLRVLPPWMLRGLVAGLGVPGLRDALVPGVRDAWRRARFPGAREMTAAEFRFQLAMAAAADFGLLRDSLPAVRAPAFVAWTEDDPLVEPALSEALLAALPGATTLMWAEGGHNLQKTHADELAAALLPWLAGLPP